MDITEKNPIGLPKKGTKITGTTADDYINAAEYVVPKKGTNKGKGFTIKGGNGDDTIIGTSGKDVIYGNAGNDDINAGAGNDKIIGGTGTNTIILSTKENFGSDTVVLTKGENLRLQLDVEEDAGSYVEYKLSGKNLVLKVYGVKSDEEGLFNKDDLKGTVTIKNYTQKDVLTSAGSLVLCDMSEEEVDLKSEFFTTKLTNSYKKTSVSGTWVNDIIDASEYQLYKNSKRTVEINTVTKKGLTIKTGAGTNQVTGSKYSDKITGGAGVDIIYGGTGNDTIKGGAGDDFLYGEAGNDTITGGAGNDTINGGAGNDTITGNTGKNTVVFENDFGTDTINMTKGEELILDLSACGTENIADLKFQIVKNDIKIFVPDLNGTVGTIVLKDFAKTNIVGSEGSVTLLLSNGKTVDLNEGDGPFLSFTKDDFSANGTFIGSRLSEQIDARGLGKNATISAGAGSNVIYSTDGNTDKITAGNDGNTLYVLSGNKTITTGLKNDEFHISGTGSRTIKAGSGENDFYLDNSSAFGDITILEEKVGAKNNIYFEQNNEYTYTRVGNNLRMNDGSSSLTLNDVFGVNSKYAQYTVNGSTLDELFATVSQFNVEGKGTITGTKYVDNIKANDALVGAKASNDIIKSGKGNDTINAGLGRNTLYFYTGDGVDTVLNGGGTDTLVFEKNANVRIDIDAYKNDNKLIIYYGTGDDKVIVDDYSSSHSVKYIKEGTKTKSVSDYLPKEPVVTPDKKISPTSPEYYGYTSTSTTNSQIYGTGNDDILVGGKGNDTIYGRGGQDQLFGGAGNDTIRGGDGDDKIYGGIGHDNLAGGNGHDVFYFYNGDGQDYINETNTFKPENTNTLYFYGVNLNNLKFEIKQNPGDKNNTEYDLIISGYGAKTDNITLAFFNSSIYGGSDHKQSYKYYYLQSEGMDSAVNMLEYLAQNNKISTNYLPDDIVSQVAAWQGAASTNSLSFDYNGSATLMNTLNTNLSVSSGLNIDNNSQQII